jgi:hypothetical protein
MLNACKNENKNILTQLLVDKVQAQHTLLTKHKELPEVFPHV